MASRTITSAGLNLPTHQVTSFGSDELRHETVIIPSTSQVAFGSYSVKEKGLLLHDVALNFNVSAISGLNGSVTNYPNFSPAFFWFTRIEIVINNNVIDTLYPSQQFIQNQLFNSDEKRRLVNNAAGAYDSLAQRNAMAIITSNYYVDLWTLFQQTNLPLLWSKDDVQVRVYMDTLPNIVNQSSLTGTPVATLNYANLVMKVSRLPHDLLYMRRDQIVQNAEQTKFHELRYGTFTVQSGVTASTLVLTPLVGLVAFLYFTVRPPAALTGNSEYMHTAISNYAILDNTSTNITGGQAIPSALSLTILNKEWIDSTYTAETALGIVNNGANVYLYSFSADPSTAAKSGASYGAHRFMGNEQLQITFTGSLAANVQVDVYAKCEALIEQTNYYTKN